MLGLPGAFSLRRRAGLLGLVLSLGALAAAPAQSQVDFEVRLKTEFIERFIRFIEWPQEQTGWSQGQAFTVCVYGRSPMADALRTLTSEQPLRGLRARPAVIEEPSELERCQVVFIAPTVRRELADILALTSGRPILTISDSPGFALQGVLINFIREGDYIRFEINAAAVKESGLRFSSKLLRLATLVGEG